MARQMVEELMANADAMARSFESAPPPKSGHRPLKFQGAERARVPAVVIPLLDGVPRVYDDIDDIDDDDSAFEPTSLVSSGHSVAASRQSGATKLLEIDSAIRAVVPPAATSTPQGPSKRPFAFPPPEVAALDPAPRRRLTRARLVALMVGGVVVGLVALAVYFSFRA